MFKTTRIRLQLSQYNQAVSIIQDMQTIGRIRHGDIYEAGLKYYLDIYKKIDFKNLRESS